LPNPKSGESETAFVSRCISTVMQENPETDQKQAAAVCYSKFRNEAVHPDFQRIIGLFLKRYGKEGVAKFAEFVQKNSLNISRMYNPKSQFHESFEWVESLITPYKQDGEAKYWLVRALTANISMNNNDYGPYDRLENATPSMNYRPVNINHDHNQWLPYPRTRIDFAKADDFSVECTLRVDNRDRKLQEMLENGEIKHPSIEGRPDPWGGYHFTGLALLTAGQELPGDPLTEILPLVFNESVGKSLCRVENGNVVCGCSNQSNSEVKEKMSDAEPKIMCPEGQHFDVKINKCVPDVLEPSQKEEKTASNLRLKAASFELENIKLKEDLVFKDEQYKALESQLKRFNAESTKRVEDLTQTKYTLEGQLSEALKNNDALESKEQRSNERIIELSNREQKALHEVEEAIKSRDAYKEMHMNERKTRELTFAENQKLSTINLQLTNDLTEAKAHEVAWLKEKTLFTEDLSKAMKHQKYLYNFLKEHNFAIVEATS
jgi:hypothetical protein